MDEKKDRKEYEKPEMQVIEVTVSEVIACSSLIESKPGHGWGDRNHSHSGPPGQNKKGQMWEEF